MLSDTVVQWRSHLMPLVKEVDAPGLFLTLRLIEIEVRNMELAIEQATGRPHVPLNDWLLSNPSKDQIVSEETQNAF